MASQTVGEDCKANVDPAAVQEPEREVLPNSLPERSVDSREGLEGNADQVIRQGPGFQENLHPEDQSQPTTNEEGNTSLFSLSFPRKLWTIVQNEAFQSVKWSENGDTIMIEVDLFQREILHRTGAEKIFQTESLKSFIHQLNLYGFRKINPEDSAIYSPENKRIMMYRNFNFQRDKPGLLQYMWGKGDLRNIAHQGICIPIPLRTSPPPEPISKRKKGMPIRCSPQFHHKAKEEEDIEESGREIPNDQRAKGNKSFGFSTVWAMKSVPGCSLGNWSTEKSSNPSGEHASDSVMLVPPEGSGLQGTEAVPSTSSSGCPNLQSVISLYNNCCSVLLSALSERPPSDTSDEEEEEGSSDYKCVICESIKKSHHQ